MHPLPGSQVGRIRGVIAPRRLVPSEFVLNRPRPDGRPGAYLPAQPMKACGLVFGGVLRHLVRVLRPKFSQLVAKVEGLRPEAVGLSLGKCDHTREPVARQRLPPLGDEARAGSEIPDRHVPTPLLVGVGVDLVAHPP